FDALFRRARLAERFDLAVMSTKGMTVSAARRLIDELSGRGVETLVLHDFDLYGLGILHTMRTTGRRYRVKNKPLVRGLGLRLEDVVALGLDPEEVVYPKTRKDPRERLRVYGATEDECDYLVRGRVAGGTWAGQRVELNAPTAGQLIQFV